MSEGISLEELQLAARNHGMPLEALRWDVTPIGLHYLLTHYDIPDVDAETWRLEVDGLVDRELSLSLDDIRSRPAVEAVVTMECAGNGRARVEPHVVSQPWLLEAVGTARWRGVSVAGLLEDVGVQEGAAHALFVGLDRGVEGGEEQEYARSVPLEELAAADALLAYEVNGVPLPPQHGFPLRLVVPGWYGMTSVKWIGRITLHRRAARRVPDAPLLPAAPGRGRGGRPDHADGPTLADGSARARGVPHARSRRRSGRLRADGPGVVGRVRDRLGGGVGRRWRDVGGCGAR